ncbi:unnamed protein product [Brassica oleracea]
MGSYWKSKAEKALCTLFVTFTKLQLTHTCTTWNGKLVKLILQLEEGCLAFRSWKWQTSQILIPLVLKSDRTILITPTASIIVNQL